MNILPKKNWHVRSRTNIARVHADEAKAAAEERKEQERIRFAEQEARTNILRQQARGRLTASAAGHREKINVLFGGEDGKDESAGNKDYEREKKEEEERQEKAIGLLTYLGQSALDSQHSKPWWSEAPGRPSKRTLDAESDKLRTEWDSKKKGRLDPMARISQATAAIRERDEEARAQAERPISQRQRRAIDAACPRLPDDILRPKARDRPLPPAPESERRRRKKEKKAKKEKKRKKEKERKERKEREVPSPGPVASSAVDIEALRRERLERERSERARELAVLQRHLLETAGVAAEEEEVDERAMPYNSAFNPHLCRRRDRTRRSNDEIVSDLLRSGEGRRASEGVLRR